MNDWVNVTFTLPLCASWTADEEAINYKGKKYPYSKIRSITVSGGSVTVKGDGILLVLGYAKKQDPLIKEFVAYVNDIIDKNNGVKNSAIYSLTGARGRYIKVYEDKVIIKVNATTGSILTGNSTDGSKTIYYSDVIGVQYKECGLTLGYLQLETASLQMNNKNSNFFSENSFTFNADLNAKMAEVSKYVQERVEYFKNNRNNPQQVVQATSSADELLKFKELLDMGVISQEEFDAKKKQLLGL